MYYTIRDVSEVEISRLVCKLRHQWLKFAYLSIASLFIRLAR